MQEKDKAELTKMIQQTKQRIEELNQQYGGIEKEMKEYKGKCKEVEQKIAEQQNMDNEEAQIRLLVSDLEEKVQGLIQENDRLNSLLKGEQKCGQSEKQKLQRQIGNSAKEVESLKQKYEEQARRQQESGKVDLKVYNAQVEDLEEKIKLLIEENDNLNNVVQHQIQHENKIVELEEE